MQTFEPNQQRRRPQNAADGRTRVARADGNTRVARPAGEAKRPSGGNGGGGNGPRRRRPTKKSMAKHIFFNVLKAGFCLGCALMVVVAMLGVSLTRYVVDSTQNDDMIFDLQARSASQTSFIMARDANGNWVEYQKLTDEANSIWVPLDQMPAFLKDAIISTEDKNFETNSGVDWGRTIYAALNSVFHFKDNTFGASTITQQLVKNLTGEKEADGVEGYKRKLREIFRALGLTNTYGKDMVLEAYLNTLPLSGTIVGVQAAAREYFGKDVSELNLEQCALIAGITQAPGSYNPYTHPDTAVLRRNEVMGYMLRDGKITQEQYDAASAAPLVLYDGPKQADTSAEESGVFSYFTDTVLEAVVADLIKAGLASNRTEALHKFYNGGLRIYATVNMQLQDIMEDVYEHGYDEDGLFPDLPVETEVTDENGNTSTQTVLPQSSMAVVDYSGALVGVVGGIGEKTASLSFNRAIQSTRQIGSTMKPLTAYGMGIDYGVINYSSMISDSYVLASTPGGELNWPHNYPGTNGGIPTDNNMLVCDALAQSLNTVPARIGDWLTAEAMFEHLRDSLEVTSLVESGDVNDVGLSSMVLGGMTHGMSMGELAAAYTIYGAGGESGSYGVHNTLHCYERVEDSQGNVILRPDILSMQAVSPETGYIMNRLMANVLASSGPVSGTARGMALETSEAVAKTGTTSDDKDRLFVGITPNFVSAVWWGYDTNEVIKWSAAASTNPPPNVWKTVMDRIQAEMPEASFSPAPATVTPQRFCRDSGYLAGPHCANTQMGYYTENNKPEECPLHADGAAA